MRANEFPINAFSEEVNYQRIYHINCLNDIDQKLPTELSRTKKNSTVRCGKCGFPLKRSYKKNSTNASINDTENIKEEFLSCLICKRSKILDYLLLSSYILAASVFVLAFVGVIFNQLGVDIWLMIGCLEIIGLLFFGRFLEDLLYFRMTSEEKLIAALYRYSESGEIQALDIANSFLKKINTKEVSSEFFKGVLNVLTFQPDGLPSNFFTILGEKLAIPINSIINNISTEIDDQNEEHYLSNLIHRAPPAGVGSILQLVLSTDNKLGLNQIVDYVVTILEKKDIPNEWQKEFSINQSLYQNCFEKTNRNAYSIQLTELIKTLPEVKVPTITVYTGSRKIMNNPLVRYLFRILIYIILAFIIGGIYQLLNLINN